MLHMARRPAAPRRKAQTMGYSVGGKTGTAHKQEGKGYASQQVPRLVRRHGADRQSAHHRRGDGRRAEPAASTSAATSPRRCSAEVVQQTLRMMGVQPDLERQAADRARTTAEEESF